MHVGEIGSQEDSWLSRVEDAVGLGVHQKGQVDHASLLWLWEGNWQPSGSDPLGDMFYFNGLAFAL